MFMLLMVISEFWYSFMAVSAFSFDYWNFLMRAYMPINPLMKYKKDIAMSADMIIYVNGFCNAWYLSNSELSPKKSPSR
jgi:hypothetical protein